MNVLLTGATGFVGGHLYPALVAAGHDVICTSRGVARARAAMPARRWAELDLERPDTLDAALRGCDAAFYLIHGMGGGRGYPEREAAGARAFAGAAARAGVGRILYLGGVMPAHSASRHLSSRARTGAILRSGAVDTIELRAAMIIGAGSASWTMVRDLAARLPAMILPRWLRNHSHPIAIDDVVRALLVALTLAPGGSHILEIPGAERIAHSDLLRRVGAMIGRRHQPMISVPVLTPRLSSYWIAAVTRVDLQMARELVEGIRADLDPTGDLLWDHVRAEPMALDDAIRLALADSAYRTTPSPDAVARAQMVGRRFAGVIA